MPEPFTAFAGYPSVVIYKEPVPGETKGKTALNHLLWGDYLSVLEVNDDWCRINSRGTEGWVPVSQIQQERLLEINFVDVGQGDGCLIITPDDKWLVVDAGVGDNMYRFLRWRFGKFKKKVKFTGIITHPDSDHYSGFDPLFKAENVSFDSVYHNGIIERKAETASLGLGPKGKHPQTGKTCLLNVVRTLAELRGIIDQPDLIKGKKYPTMLKLAVDSGRVGDVRMLASEEGHLAGFEADKPLSIRVLGPVPMKGEGGKWLLPWFGSVGKTKNGHSVVLKLEYRDFSALLGGDLNIPAEEYLLQHHTGLKAPPKSMAGEEELVAAARATFEVDLAKSCHHGSADFSEVYLRAVNAAAVVISSGDDEPHAHPRSDSLGALGKYGRGQRPLIFSTELARSSKDVLKQPFILQEKLRELQKKIEEEQNPAKKDKARAAFEKEVEKLERSVAVYGMIAVRTDGTKLLVAQKLERPRSKSSKWDIYRMEPNGAGQLQYVSKH